MPYSAQPGRGFFPKKNGEKANFILVFLGPGLYNIEIERAWGGDIPLAVFVVIFNICV